MDSTKPLLVLYSRADAFGDGLLRIPALRAARTAFPEHHIIYASSRGSTLEVVLRRHVDHLVDELRTRVDLFDLLAEKAARPRKTAIVDFRMVGFLLIATRLKLLGRGFTYEANFPNFGLSTPSSLGKFVARPEHNAWRYHRLVEHAAGRRLPFDYRLDIPETARTLAREIRGQDRRPMILICGNSYTKKRMALQQIVHVAGSLIGEGFDVRYLETPGAGGSAQELAEAEPRVGVVGPGLGFGPAVLDDIYRALGEMSAAYIGIEGGMAHLLATVDTPMVIINHGVSIERWRPLSGFVEVVEARPHGAIADTPPSEILEAVHRLITAKRRDHPSA